MPPRAERFQCVKDSDNYNHSSENRSDRDSRRAARDIKRSGEVLPLFPQAESKIKTDIAQELSEGESFDQTGHFKSAKKAYIDLGNRILKMGIRPSEIPFNAWDLANIVLDNVKKYSKEYAVEQDPKKRSELVARMDRLVASLNNGQVNYDTEEAARRLRNERRDALLPERKAEEAFGALVSDILKKIPDEINRMLLLSARNKKASPESIIDIDTSHLSAKQYMPKDKIVELQKEMDLQAVEHLEIEQEKTPREWRNNLMSLISRV